MGKIRDYPTFAGPLAGSETLLIETDEGTHQVAATLLKGQKGDQGEPGPEGDTGPAGPGVTTTTWAARPSLTAGDAGAFYWFSDVGTQGKLMRWSGTAFEADGDIRVRRLIGTIALPAGSTAGLRDQITFPAGLLRAGSYIVIDDMAVEKSGTSESMGITLRFGTQGNASDQALTANASIIANTNRNSILRLAIKISSNTTAECLTVNSQPGYGTTTNTPTSITIPSVATNSMYLSVYTNMTASTETGTIKRFLCTLAR